jgi:hypothetical protein
MVVRCNRKQSASVGDVLFFCESFHHALELAALGSVRYVWKWLVRLSLNAAVALNAQLLRRVPL